MLKTNNGVVPMTPLQVISSQLYPANYKAFTLNLSISNTATSGNSASGTLQLGQNQVPFYITSAEFTVYQATSGSTGKRVNANTEAADVLTVQATDAAGYNLGSQDPIDLWAFNNSFKNVETSRGWLLTNDNLMVTVTHTWSNPAGTNFVAPILVKFHVFGYNLNGNPR